MAYEYIDGIGLVSVSPKKHLKEIDATLDYYRTIAPKYQELGGFAAGFNDTESMIFRWWENIYKTDDEEKDTWFKQEVEEWGKMVGYTDSQALLKFYKEVEKVRPLTAKEEADRDGNITTMTNFEADMYDAYENHSGDISDVQKKYGYDEEELGVLNGLWEFGKLAVTNPKYMLGSIAGMVAKDPELLLLGLLRIPAMAAQGAARVTQLASMAIKVQPKYVQTLSKAIQGNRGRAMIGRGAEGATYAGTYEALHDLTFKGHIKKENVERGLALGTLLGSAFGAVSKNVGNQSWLIAKQGSLNAEKMVSRLKYSLHDPELKWQSVKGEVKGEGVLTWEKGWQQKWDNIKKADKGYVWNTTTKKFDPPAEPAPKGKPLDATGAETTNVKYKPRPEEAKLPKGLDHKSRYELWRERVIALSKEESRIFSRATKSEPLTEAALKDFVDAKIMHRMRELLLKKNKDGSLKYTKEEASGLAAKEVAKELELRNTKFLDKEAKALPRGQQRTNSPRNKQWGTRREQQRGAEVNAPEIRDATSFRNLFKIDNKELPKPTGKQLATAGGIGAALGMYIAEEDRVLGGLVGALALAGARRGLRGINKSKAALKLKMYETMGKSEGLMFSLRAQEGKVHAIVAQVLKGKHPELSSLDFLTYLEHWSKHSHKIKGRNRDWGAVGRRELTQEMKDALSAFRGLMEDFRKVAVEIGVLKEEQFITDYVSHLFRNKKQTPQSIKEFKDNLKNAKNKSDLDSSTRFNELRGLVDDIQTLSKKYPDLETDVFKILDAYSRSMSKAIAGKNTIKILESQAIQDGKNAVGVIIREGELNRSIIYDGKKMSFGDYARDKLGYQVSNHPALRGKLIHPLVKNAIDDFFAPEIGTEGLLNKMIVVNNAMKRLLISFSFFHAQALVLSGAYSGILGEVGYGVLPTKRARAGRARFKEIRRIMKGEWENFTDKDGNVITKKNVHGQDAQGQLVGAQLIKEMAEEGVGLGMKASEYVDAGYNTVKALMDKHAPPAAKVQGFIDKWTWDKTHDISKAFVYLTMKQRMMSTTPRGIGKLIPLISKMRGRDLGKWEAMSEAEARSLSAAFVNDAFGGQRHAKLAIEWQKKAIENANNPKGQMYQMLALWTTPSKAKLSNLALFSPDWTVSNLRIGFRGLGMTKDLFGKIAKGEKFTPKEMAEWNLYMGYWVRALASTSLMAYVLHDLLTDETDAPFDLQEFWYTGRLNIGGGEEMVVSKQIAEPLHWLVNPMHTFMNKTAALPKVGMEAILGKEWISFKGGDSERLFFRGGNMYGRKLKMSDPKQLAWWAGNHFTPISFSKLTRAYREDGLGAVPEQITPSVTGMLGFPTYPYTED